MAAQILHFLHLVHVKRTLKNSGFDIEAAKWANNRHSSTPRISAETADRFDSSCLITIESGGIVDSYINACKGKPVERRGRKVSGLKDKFLFDLSSSVSGATR